MVSEAFRILFSQVPSSKLKEALIGSLYTRDMDAALSSPFFPGGQALLLTLPVFYLPDWGCCREVLLPFMAAI